VKIEKDLAIAPTRSYIRFIDKQQRVTQCLNLKKPPTLEDTLLWQSALLRPRIAWSNPGYRIGGISEHQKEACRLVGIRLRWHPKYVGEICPTPRPPLVASVMDTSWQEDCQNWQMEHDLSVENLADLYEPKFLGIYSMILSPFDWHDNVRVSAHDEDVLSQPVSEW
jgi:hypothetical protein